MLLGLSLPLTGCLLDDECGSPYEISGSRSRGVSLSQAMTSSASGSTAPLHGSGSSESYTTVDSGAYVAAASGGGVAATADEGRDYRLEIPADVAYSVPLNGEFRSIVRYTLTPLCAETDRACLGVFLTYDQVDLNPDSLPASAIKNTRMLELGVSGRVYLNRAHAFISPYFSANVACQALLWDYRNPVYVDSEKIESDTLIGMGGYAGLGIALYRNGPVNLFGEAGFGGTVFTDQTGQGFGNDVFHNFGYFQVKAGLSVKF